MKKYLSVCVLLLVMFTLGCSSKQPLANKILYPNIDINKPFQTKNAEYIISINKPSDELALTVKNISKYYDSITVKIFTESMADNSLRNAQIALYLKQNDSYTFNLPLTADNLPILVNFTEEYNQNGAEHKDAKTFSAGFTVGKHHKSNPAPKVKDITPNNKS